MKKLVLASAFLLVISIIGLGSWYYRAEEAHVSNISQVNLIAISNLKIDQITKWRVHLLETAELISQDQGILRSLNEYINEPGSIDEDQLFGNLVKAQSLLNSQSVRIFDPTTGAMFRFQKSTELDQYLLQAFDQAKETHRPVLTDLFYSTHENQPVLELVVPVYPGGQDRSHEIFLVFSIAADKFLYPLIQSWPGYSETAETLLIRRENDFVIFLNNLRHTSEAALKLSIPLDDKSIPAVMAVKGTEGVVQGIDYRGVPVMAVISKVPATDWYMITKIDLEEVFSNWQTRSFLLFGLIIAAVFAVVTLVVVLWQRNQKVHYRSILKARDELETAERELLKSSKNFQFVLKCANLGMWEWNAQTDQLKLDEIAFRLVNHSSDTTETPMENLASWLDRVHPDDRQPILDLGKSFSATGDLSHFFRFRCRVAEDEYRWVETHAGVHQKDELGNPVIITGMMKDITDQIQAQIDLKHSENRFRKVFELLPVGLWIADKNGALLNGNPAGIRIWGAEPLVGQDEYRVFKARRLPSGKEIEPHDWALVHTVTEGVTVENELLEIDAFDGVTRTILNFTAPILQEDGKIDGAIILNLDVTREKEEEKARQQLEAELHQAQKLEAIGRLAGGIAHDFNNKLQTISGFASLAMDDVDEDSEIADSLREIQKAAQSSADLTKQLLAFARRQMIDPIVLCLNTEIVNLLKMLNHLIGEEINLMVKPGNNIWSIRIDPGQIDQILANMIVNARDAIKGNGSITVTTRNVTISTRRMGAPDIPDGEYVVLSVEDTGCGIPSENLEKVFEPFFTTKPMDQGTGLGLATVFGIMKQNNGYIDVRSKLSVGTVFDLYFPRSYESMELSEENFQEIQLPKENFNILVVEDDVALLNFCKKILSKLGGNVVAESDPRNALAFAETTGIRLDLLITDVIMPELNGKQLWEQIRQHHSDCNCLFMSGYTADIISEHGIIGEDMHYIQKPFSVDQLIRKISDII